MKKIPSRIRRKRLVAKADALASLLARLRAKKETGGLCPFCHKRPIEHCFHFITRSKHIVRWDTRNIYGSCSGCNLRHEHDTVFMDDVRRWYINKFGQEQWDALYRDAHKIARFSADDLENIVKQFEMLLEFGDVKPKHAEAIPTKDR